MKHIRTCFHTLLDPGLDFRVRLFNILAIGGMAVSLIMVFCSLFMGAWPNVCLNFLLALVSGGLFLYSYHSGHYQRCYLITIVLIFLIFFPVMFFTSGGYQGGMPLFFVFAVIFTILMLEKCLAILVSITEVLLYLLLCLLDYLHPEYITAFVTEADRLIDVLAAFLSVSIGCGTVLYFHLREYNEQQRLLAEQNLRLRQYVYAKSTFL